MPTKRPSRSAARRTVSVSSARKAVTQSSVTSVGATGSVLFADLVGATRWAETTRPADLAHLLVELERVIRRAVTGHGLVAAAPRPHALGRQVYFPADRGLTEGGGDRFHVAAHVTQAVDQREGPAHLGVQWTQLWSHRPAGDGQSLTR